MTAAPVKIIKHFYHFFVISVNWIITNQSDVAIAMAAVFTKKLVFDDSIWL